MISDIKEIIQAFSNGEMVILIDDEDRENEGDLIVAADKLTPEHINFMIKEGRGLVCAPISHKIAERISLNLMDGVSSENHTQYTASVDALDDAVTTGISAEDRCATIKLLSKPTSTRKDFNIPGHIFPLRAMEGGVLRRAGHTEAAIDLCKESDLTEVAVVCEVIRDDGKMARLSDLIAFSKKHSIKVGTIKALIEYRLENLDLIEKVSESKLPTKYGLFNAHVYKSNIDGTEHIALTIGEISSNKPTMVRVHSECLTGDALFSSKCDCGSQLERAMEIISGHVNRGNQINFNQNKVGEIISSFNKLAIAMLKIEEAKSIFLNKQILKTESATLKIIY